MNKFTAMADRPGNTTVMCELGRETARGGLLITIVEGVARDIWLPIDHVLQIVRQPAGNGKLSSVVIPNWLAKEKGLG